MSEKKVLIKDRVITCGAGERRAVLCYDSGLAYKYNEPDKILAVYHRSAWYVLKLPYYRSSGWGNSSSGDADGYHLISNVISMLRSIGASIYIVDLPEFLDLDELIALESEINKIKKTEAELKYQGISATIEYPKYTGKVESNYYSSKKGKGTDVFKTMDAYDKALAVFRDKNGKAVLIDAYSVTANKIMIGKQTLAFRDANDKVWLNSQMFNLSQFEREFLGGQSLIQKLVRQLANYSIPFNVLEAANLKLSDTRIIESGPESDHTLNNGSTRHFTGALLLENNGRKFLMDIDRQEISYGIFNVFFVEVDAKANSIESAYESMMPDEVKLAKANGIEIRRQGEWFFVDANQTLQVAKKDIGHWQRNSTDSDANKPYLCRMSVSHGKGRPNSLYKPINFSPEIDSLVCGLVTHTGREHKDLDLGCLDSDGKEISFSEAKEIPYWRDQTDKDKGLNELITVKLWRLVPNSTISNFTITGDVD